MKPYSGCWCTSSAATLLCLTLLTVPRFAAAQDAASMEAEITRYQRLADTASSPAAKRSAYSRMASMLYLSGAMDRAADAWQKAAMADTNNRDDAALLEAAQCYIAAGYFDAASANIRMVLVSGKNKALTPKARYLAAVIEGFRSLDPQPLASLLPDPLYERYKPAIYYIVLRLTGDESFRQRLYAEFPNSPETLALQGGKNVSYFPSVFWTFVPAADSANVKTGGMIQVGLFGTEAYAVTRVKEVEQKGFEAEINRKTVDGKLYFVVLVYGGENINMTLSRLKAANIDAFPVK